MLYNDLGKKGRPRGPPRFGKRAFDILPQRYFNHPSHRGLDPHIYALIVDRENSFASPLKYEHFFHNEKPNHLIRN